jgi:hypothetical protein
VQRGAGDGDAADLDGVHERDGSEPTGAAHLDDDVAHRRHLRAGGELVGERPARRPRGVPQYVTGPGVVDGDHDAVYLVVEVVALLEESVPVVDGRLDVVDDGRLVGDAQAPLGEPLVHLPAGVEVGAVEHVEEEHRERALGRHRRVELSQGAGGGVAGVGEGVLAVLDEVAVVRLEGGLGHVHFAPDRERLGVVPPQPLWDARNSADVGSDVVADLAVAARGRPL